MLKYIKPLICTFLYCLSLSAFADDITTLDWADLIPESEKKAYTEQFINRASPQVNHQGSGPAAQNSQFGMPRQELDGKHVKIPGFVIPLEGDDKLVTEFLLVPFMGACIHVPPPPPNQIVYVKFKDGIEIGKLWEVVVVEGIMKVETTSAEIAQSSYLLEGIDSEPYRSPN